MSPRSNWFVLVSILALGDVARTSDAGVLRPQDAPVAAKAVDADGAPSVPLPRPVDPELRAFLGFAPPRDPDVVIAKIDALTTAMRPIVEQNDVWKQRFLEYLSMQGQRVSLVSELEEANYQGERRTELLAMKLADIGGISRDWPSSTYSRLREEMAKRHAGTPLGVRANADDLLEKVHAVLDHDFRIHPDDYPRLAAVELTRKDDELAGITLLEALHFEPATSELQTKWQDWIVENLGPQSIGVRTVIRRRTFGHPIRLEGEGLDHEKLDTAEWRGDVILIDFWGTWCVPCKEAMPLVKAARDKHAAEGLRVASVLCDFEFDKARRFLKERGYDWPQFTRHDATVDDYLHPIATKYAVGGYPTLWIIDRNGVLCEETDVENLEEALAKYLAEPRPAKDG